MASVAHSDYQGRIRRWRLLFTSGFDTFPWWESVEFLEGSRRIPGKVRLEVTNPDDRLDMPLTFILTAEEIDMTISECPHWVFEPYAEGLCRHNSVTAETADILIQHAVFGAQVFFV